MWVLSKGRTPSVHYSTSFGHRCRCIASSLPRASAACRCKSVQAYLWVLLVGGQARKALKSFALRSWGLGVPCWGTPCKSFSGPVLLSVLALVVAEEDEGRVAKLEIVVHSSSDCQHQHQKSKAIRAFFPAAAGRSTSDYSLSASPPPGDSGFTAWRRPRVSVLGFRA